MWCCSNPEDNYLSIDQLCWQRWMKRYRKWLAERSSIDEPLLPDEVMQILRSAGAEHRERLLPEKILLQGFLQLPEKYKELVRCLEECGVEVLMLGTQCDAVVHVASYDDDDSELLCIATQMRNELEINSDQTLGLVVGDLQQRRDDVLRAFERVFYPGCSPEQIRAQAPVFEVSLGRALSAQPVVSMALLLMRLCTQRVGESQLSAILLSPYWLAAKNEARRRERHDRRLRDERIKSQNLKQFQEHLYNGSRLKPALTKLLKQRDCTPATFSVWGRRFSAWLDILGWPTTSIESEEYQAVSSWLECLDDLQLLDDGTTVSAVSALSQLQKLADERVFQIESPLSLIHI